MQCLALGCEGRSLAGRSAACLWGLPISSTGTLTVEVVGKTERTRARTVYRHVPPGGIVSAEVNGFRVLLTSPQLTVIDIARWHGIGEAVRVAEAALYKKVIDMEALERALTSRSRCHNMDQAREAMRFITGFSESPGKVTSKSHSLRLVTRLRTSKPK
ncbi:hypothetical protein HMPREF1219_01592 [Corynebacterium pyruviciproducens ATCC BAA-1742]|uniref:AbiEi antitoxin C-terminal domain-containing protein n=1 Tax=Corynebacterium pyruviciproducens ATCC BAA-1742 TaxID=1125779 RepID=S2YVM3_9CORY|nr:hypothetical protein HMPREF1219_01592 [Corynebacterium pyruviciproducens ATCC BAA-1742]